MLTSVFGWLDTTDGRLVSHYFFWQCVIPHCGVIDEFAQTHAWMHAHAHTHTHAWTHERTHYVNTLCKCPSHVLSRPWFVISSSGPAPAPLLLVSTCFLYFFFSHTHAHTHFVRSHRLTDVKTHSAAAGPCNHLPLDSLTQPTKAGSGDVI